MGTEDIKKYRAEIAQSVEQGTENPRVGGSIPPLGIRTVKGLQLLKLQAFFIFWPHRNKRRKDGTSLSELARLFEMSPSAVGYAVERVETIAAHNRYD